MKPSILIVDDRPENLLVLEDQLEQFNLNIVRATSGQEALKLSVKEDYALILLDVQIPEMNGFETAEILRTLGKTRHIPIIFVTAISKEEKNIFKGYESGAVDYLFKPIQPHVLKSKVKIFLELHQQKKELESFNQKLEEKVAEQTRELRKMSRTFRLFVPKQFSDRIDSQGVDFLQPGYFHEEKFTILFSDIRSYTNLSEKMTPHENFEFLNDYLNLMEPHIAKNHGFVDKFIGDGIMALFDQQNSAEQAVQTSIAMHHEIHQYNESRGKKQLPLIRFGVGINTGPVVIGALGSPQRLDSTVIGDAVNSASRLEQLTKKYDVRILISHYTCQEIDQKRYLLREIDTVKLKGKDKPIRIYEVFDCDPPEIIVRKQAIQDLFFQAVNAYKAVNFSEALALFKQCFDRFPEDMVVLDYLKRCNYLLKNPPQDLLAWDGVIENTIFYKIQEIGRKFPRIRFDTRVHFENKEIKLVGNTKDVSCTGIRIIQPHPMEIGETILLNLFHQQEGIPSDLSSSSRFLSRVVWKEKSQIDEDHPLWMLGLEFIMLTSEQEKMLLKMMEALLLK